VSLGADLKKVANSRMLPVPGIESCPTRKVTSLTYNGSSYSFITNIFIPSIGCGLDYRDSRVRFPAGAVNFSLHYRVQNGSGAHPASYQMGTRGFFPGGKVAGA